MSRLIDVDKLISSLGWLVESGMTGNKTKAVIKLAIQTADGQPTVDAVEVVRCRDCKYAHMTYGGECKSCDMWTDDDDFTMTLYLDGDFYCAFAERREDGKTD